MKFLHFIFGIIQKIERYLVAKSASERAVIFVLSGLCAGVLLWRFIVPTIEEYTRELYRLSDLRRADWQNEREQETHLQHFKNKQIALEILAEQIQERYVEIEQTHQIWQDILGEISKIIVDTDRIPDEIRATNNGKSLILKGNAEWLPLLELINLLERNIVFLQVDSIVYTQNLKEWNYELKMSNPIKTFETIEQNEEAILRFLNSSSHARAPVPKIAIPKTSPTIMQTAESPSIVVQAFMSNHAKINGEWFAIGEIKNGIRLIGIEECGVVLEKAQQRVCIHIDVSRKK